MNDFSPTPLYYLETIKNNDIYIKRDDLLPFSFGGNKARKGLLFFKDILTKNNDSVITYGSYASNHCRVIANLAYRNKILCTIISPTDSSTSFNQKMIRMLDARIKFTEIENVASTIQSEVELQKKIGNNPYFIPGGGHGNLGTQAYIDCYEEIYTYEALNDVKFDYIFLASGTGSTQAGLIIGSILKNTDVRIIGISIARLENKGSRIIEEAVDSYLVEHRINQSGYKVNFVDDYISGGYSLYNDDIKATIQRVFRNYGIPFDTTYTGKAYEGMIKYLSNNMIDNKKILFIHTGGAPIFFDYLIEV